MIPTRTELLFERSTLTREGQPKKRTRDNPLRISAPTRRDLYARLERRFRDSILSLRKTIPAKAQRRTQSLNKRRSVLGLLGASIRPGFRLPRRTMLQAPRRAAGGIGILRNR